jgi:hypothetical protein
LHRLAIDDELPERRLDTGQAEMSEFQDGTSPDADHRPAAFAAPGHFRTAGITPTEQQRTPCSVGYRNRWDDGLRMLAVTAERLATDADRAEVSGYLATIPADSAERLLD